MLQALFQLSSQIDKQFAFEQVFAATAIAGLLVIIVLGIA
jgi:hypothetical protein